MLEVKEIMFTNDTNDYTHILYAMGVEMNAIRHG